MVAEANKTPNSVSFSGVYTPDEFRNRGYASNAVAGATQLALDRGRKFCALFADRELATPMRIYRSVGYRPLRDHLYIEQYMESRCTLLGSDSCTATPVPLKAIAVMPERFCPERNTASVEPGGPAGGAMLVIVGAPGGVVQGVAARQSWGKGRGLNPVPARRQSYVDIGESEPEASSSLKVMSDPSEVSSSKNESKLLDFICIDGCGEPRSNQIEHPRSFHFECWRFCWNRSACRKPFDQIKWSGLAVDPR